MGTNFIRHLQENFFGGHFKIFLNDHFKGAKSDFLVLASSWELK